MRASQKMPPSIFGKPTFRDSDAAKDIFRTVDDRKNMIDYSNPLGALVDEVLEETGNADLKSPEVKKEELGLMQDIKEADEKMESISNRVGDQSVFTKMSNKSYISAL